ncbi:MAG: hypothetical protein M3Z64_06715 [Verrucomicrobiota bacterium]|nr:hypothetical protein [Verrucomicrobiota bacterium]
MKFNKLTYILPTACTLLAFAACSKNDTATKTTADSSTKSTGSGASALVGTWQDSDGAETITYKADGTMSEKLASGDVVNGTYSMPDATHIKVKFDGAMAAMGEQTFPVTMTGDGMDMTSPTGAAVHYKKTK